ncbi:hypothetical protein WJX84_004298 [Apatococcus fuscideae]|uniref:Fe2OG dioxygenase domain-containing protein n=1 Tax=Apatococcus fuscideae TaxID=2026836 RepID=A0AAW1SM72_9CHLO
MAGYSKRKAVSELASPPVRPKVAETLHPGVTEISTGCTLIYEQSAFPDPQREEHLAFLKDKVDWRQTEITVMGRKVMQPREVAYMADNGLRYTYSRSQLTPAEFPEELQNIRERISTLAGGGADAAFNCCLLNHYRDGEDHMGWHSDNERLFGTSPTIASVSFGTRRDFVLRRNSDHAQKWKCPLGEGDILIMKGA